VLEGGVGRQDRVVRLDDGRRERRGRVDRELELALLAIVARELLEEEGAKARARAATERVEDKEALEAVGVVGELADAVARRVDQLFADLRIPPSIRSALEKSHRASPCARTHSVVTTGVVVGGVLLAVDEGFGVEELAVVTRANLLRKRACQLVRMDLPAV
jgi:hypothetical protein